MGEQTYPLKTRPAGPDDKCPDCDGPLVPYQVEPDPARPGWQLLVPPCGHRQKMGKLTYEYAPVKGTE